MEIGPLLGVSVVPFCHISSYMMNECCAKVARVLIKVVLTLLKFTAEHHALKVMGTFTGRIVQ